MTLHLLTAPTSLGNRPYESDGTARHTDRGPARLREHRVVERLGAHDLGDVAAAPYRDFVRPPGGVRNEDLVQDHVQRISRAIPRDGFTLVLGGDCSTLVGCLGALRHEGLVFVDGRGGGAARHHPRTVLPNTNVGFSPPPTAVSFDRMTADELRAEIVRLGPWHHDVEVAPGVRTGDVTRSITYDPAFGNPTIIQPERRIAQLVEEVFPEGLAGRTFLDCACNAGGYLFAAARSGAGRGFGFDVRDHWIRQARFLARHLASEGIEFDTRDLAALPGLGLEPFDVTFFNGIFYHLPDPVAGLRIAADLTKELLIVSTACKPAKTDSLVLNPESTTEVMSGVHRLAWLPSSERVLREILKWCGFPHTRLGFLRRSGRDLDRMEILAARSVDTFARYDAARASHVEGPARRWLRRLFG